MSVATPVKETSAPVQAPTTAQGTLIDTLPLKLVMMLAAPYLAGRNANDALAKAHKIYKESRFASTIDILGEDAHVESDCDQSVENYKKLIDLIANNRIACSNPLEQMTVSFKPSMFSVISPVSAAADKQKQLDRAYDRIESIVKHAKAKDLRVTLEAEDHSWTDFHLDTYYALINAGYHNCGTVIQSRLFRTKEDIKKFDERMRVRMVIGIYNEPAEIALTQKPEMKKLAVEYAKELLARGVYVELASHDTDCMDNFIEDAVLTTRTPAKQFEIQHLLGVPRKEIQQAFVSGKYFVEKAEKAGGNRRDQLADLARSGVLMRMYLPYGTDNVAGPYCKRRLKANPNMIGYGIKNFLNIK
ncbi:MAG: proline dehydrogenase family protein [Candidatus Obscuribacterales bacterium]|nr:proline dehydrogenase family protein [Candidatus Obscuribacterales bacterium]